ncbi:MAG: ABC transporter substrate-binding protein [Clostridia bacterium]|nr:ABC transporter substrate-binding protein [Clostridia bacterium]
MTIKRACAVLIALLLTVPLGAFGSEVRLWQANERQVSRNVATTLDNLPEAARSRTDSLVIGVTDLVGEINPFFARTMGDQYAASLMFDELVFANVKGEYGTGVASCAFNGEASSFTFTLQEKTVYADGEPIRSDDFINALYLITMPGFAGTFDVSGASIAGLDAYLAGESGAIDGIRRVDDRTFTVVVTVPNPESIAYFAIPALRTSVFGDMRRPESLRDAPAFLSFYEERLAAVRAADASAMAYGQYTLLSLTPGDGAVLGKNLAYFRGEPYIGEVRLSVIPIGQELDAMLSGTIDIASVFASVDLVDAAVDRQSGFINLYSWRGDVVGYLGFNLTHPLFQDADVRRALAAGLNRENARQSGIERYGAVPTAMMFDVFEGAVSPPELYPFDLERAAGLLDSAGWTLEEDGIRAKEGVPFRFTMHYAQNNPIMEITLPLIQADFAKLGIAMQPIPIPLEELIERIDRNDCEMYCAAQRLPTDPRVAVDYFIGEGHLNAGKFAPEPLTRDLARARADNDPTRQRVLFERLFIDLYDWMSIIPLYRRSEMILINARVMNANVSIAHDITAEVYRFFLVDTLEGQW